MNYKHLSKEERYLIQTFINKGYSLRKISSIIGRSASTISRELKRNTSLNGFYIYDKADLKAKRLSLHKSFFKFQINFKFKEFSALFSKKYNKKFFGVKATYHFIDENFPEIDKPTIRTVFNWIKTNGWTIAKKDRLRQYYKKGGKRGKDFIKRLIKTSDYVFPIWARPKKIDLREEYGHWEADLVIGKKSNGFRNILTLKERKTRYSISDFVESKNHFKINKKIRELIKNNNLIVHSITTDNGIEFEGLGLVAKWLNIIIYKAEPFASFQRGSNENYNGMLRREWKKGTDFNNISYEELKEVEKQINRMPREVLNWKTSEECFLFENFGIIE
ncbi:IS30 family transposase [Mycoplasmopsis caviae]|uniref:Transposase n=1 Tax=Mycoplasmopsis caviae TaxID=55603 RepID=A0A3P8KAH1_9BACT|nr:IS30 family transposase [Mycoplasmopsis caviae]VDR42369.1 transposase [Mycoplasmopsis caviae]